MKKYTAWVLALLFYVSVLPWNMAGATDYWNYNAKNVTGDNTGRIKDMSIGSASHTDNGYLNDLIVKGPWVDVRAGFGFVGDGVADDNVALLAAIAVSEANQFPLLLPPGTILTSSTLTFSTTPKVMGANTVIKYTGTGSAIKLMGKVNMSGVTVWTTADEANGIEFTTGTQMNYLHDVSVEAAVAGTSTGKGLFFNATASFLYGTDLNRVRSIRYKYPLYVHGANLADNTVNQITGTNVQLHCYSASVSGSTGIYFDNGAHGFGSGIRGGSIESCDVGISVANGSAGLSYSGDIEGANTMYTLGNTFRGTIEPGEHGEYYRGHSTTTSKWFQYKNHEADHAYYENYYGHKFVSYYSGELSLYAGVSIIDGGSPAYVGGIIGSGTGDNDYNTYLKLVNRKISFYSVSPQADNVACTVGDIVLNSGSDNVLGWKCTATTPTWKAMTITLAP